MTPKQALEILNVMASRGMGNRTDHQNVIEAIQVLHASITPHTPKKPQKLKNAKK